MSRRSLTFRLVSWYCGLLFAVGAAFAAFSYFSFDRYITQTIRSTLAGRADAAWGMAAGMLNDRQGLAMLIEQRFAPEALNRMIRISSGGEVYYTSGLPNDGEFDPARVEQPAAGVQSISPGRTISSFIARTTRQPTAARDGQIRPVGRSDGRGRTSAGRLGFLRDCRYC